jgi:copper(I)-binding protein
MRSSPRFSAETAGPALVAVLGLILAACSTPGPSTPGATAAGLSVTGAWVRPPAGMATPGAAYLVITNSGGEADALVGISSPVAASVELHETSTDASGMTGMHPISRLVIGPGASVALQPGGYHLMLMGIGSTLKVGDTVELELQFERAGKVVVQAEVRQG